MSLLGVKKEAAEDHEGDHDHGQDAQADVQVEADTGHEVACTGVHNHSRLMRYRIQIRLHNMRKNNVTHGGWGA